MEKAFLGMGALPQQLFVEGHREGMYSYFTNQIRGSFQIAEANSHCTITWAGDNEGREQG
jgi:hypothetical protein